jgi:hypothetical protein
MAVGAPEALESGLHINSTSAVILSALSGRGVAIVRYALVKNLSKPDSWFSCIPTIGGRSNGLIIW